MKTEMVDLAIELVQRSLEEYYHGDVCLIVSYLHEKCIWIGACAEQYYKGREIISGKLHQVSRELPSIRLTLQEYVCASHDRNSCVITGRYIAATEPGCGEFLREMQRVTFIWKQEGTKLWITHMHISNAADIIQKGEVFPHKIGRYTYNFMQKKLGTRAELGARLIIRGEKGVTYFVNAEDIMCVEASNLNTVIHTTKEDIFARMLLAEIEKLIIEIEDSSFVKIHRSFIVNKYYVTQLKRYEAVLGNRYTFAISKDRYQKVKMLFTE